MIHLRLLSATLLLGAVACGNKDEKAAAPAADTVPAAPATGAPAAANDGQYAVCSTCHQPTGLGLPPAFPPLAGSEVVNGAAEIPIAIVLHGLQGPLKVKGVDFNGAMAAWGTFSDEDIAATLTYERSSWGNSASAVTAAQVAAVRKATASRTTPWTWEELQKATLK